MKKTILHTIILLLLLSCKEKKREIEYINTTEQKDTLVIDKNVKSIEQKTQSERKKVHSPEEISVVYVTAESGLTYRKEPDINSEKLGKFGLGSKLSVIEKTGKQLEIKDEQNTIKGEWIKVISKKFRGHIGYVFSGFVIDSAKADFSKTPVDISFEFNFNKIYTETQYKEINLEFTKTTLSEFNKHLKDNRTHDESKPLKSVGNTQEGSYFILEINKKLYKFPCGKNYSRPCYSYISFNKYLNAYIIGFSGDGIYETFYLDKNNGSCSPFYEGAESYYYGSPNNKRLAKISSIDPEFRSGIAIYDINNIKSFYNTGIAYWYSSKKWGVHNVVWIDDDSLILEVYNETRIDDNGALIPIDLKYLKTTLK